MNMNMNKLVEIRYAVFRGNGHSGISETHVSMSTFLLKTADDFVAFASRAAQTRRYMPLHPHIYFPHIKLKNVRKIKVLTTVADTNEQYYQYRDYYDYQELGGGITLLPGQAIADIYSKLVPVQSEYFPDHIRYNCYIKENKNLVDENLTNILLSAAKTAGDIITFIAGPATIIQTLIAISEWWEKKHHAQSKSNNQSSIVSLSPSKTLSNITAIRLHWTNGTETEFDEWLTHPDQLKEHINAFLNNPSMKPTEVVFVLKNGKCIVVDVVMGATNNSPLENILTYLS